MEVILLTLVFVLLAKINYEGVVLAALAYICVHICLLYHQTRKKEGR